jgi:hypothetical protein
MMPSQHATVRVVVFAVSAVVLVVGVVKLYVLATRPTPPAITMNDAPRRTTNVASNAIAATPGPSSAIAAPDASARTERDTALQVMRRSGSANEVWTAQAGALFDAIRRTTALTDVECYVAGCSAMLTFSSEIAYHDGLAHLPALEEYRAWTGGKQWTIPEVQADGKVIVAVLLFRPD